MLSLFDLFSLYCICLHHRLQPLVFFLSSSLLLSSAVRMLVWSPSLGAYCPPSLCYYVPFSKATSLRETSTISNQSTHPRKIKGHSNTSLVTNGTTVNKPSAVTSSFAGLRHVDVRPHLPTSEPSFPKHYYQGELSQHPGFCTAQDDCNWYTNKHCGERSVYVRRQDALSVS